MPYTGYDELSKKRTLKYRKAKQHPVSLSYRQEEYDEVIKPAIEKTGMPIATFFKAAVAEKIEFEQYREEISKFLCKKPEEVDLVGFIRQAIKEKLTR